MRSRQTQGEEGDHGTSIFHRTPLVGLIVNGGLASAAIPELFGPRNCGQLGGESSAPETASAAQLISAAASNLLISGGCSAAADLGSMCGIGPRMISATVPTSILVVMTTQATLEDHFFLGKYAW